VVARGQVQAMTIAPTRDIRPPPVEEPRLCAVGVRSVGPTLSDLGDPFVFGEGDVVVADVGDVCTWARYGDTHQLSDGGRQPAH
jgi:hypothetical protein